MYMYLQLSTHMYPMLTGYYCIRAAWRGDPQDVNVTESTDCACPSVSTGGQCQPGYYCPLGSSSPTACEEGHYCATPGAYSTYQCWNNGS